MLLNIINSQNKLQVFKIRDSLNDEVDLGFCLDAFKTKHLIELDIGSNKLSRFEYIKLKILLNTKIYKN